MTDADARDRGREMEANDPLWRPLKGAGRRWIWFVGSVTLSGLYMYECQYIYKHLL